MNAQKPLEMGRTTPQENLAERNRNFNPATYFEIPVSDLERAMQFYNTVFGFNFEREVIDGNAMALFPFKDGEKGITGALAKGEIYKPTKDGVLIYFSTDSIDQVLKLALGAGGQILFPKTSNGDLGFVAEFEDSEGNRIALHQENKINNEIEKPNMMGLRTTIYKVDDIQQAKKWYSQAFGIPPYFDDPYYVGFNIGGYELGLQPGKSPAQSKVESVVTYWGVEDIQAVYSHLIDLGATENEKPYSLGGDLMTATVKDPFGNVIGLIYNPYFKIQN